MLEKFKNIMSIPELRKRIGFTLAILIIVRLGAHVPVPGINVDAISEAFKQYSNTLFGLYDLFSGGAFQKATLFALGIMPYISSSIIIQLMGVVVPYFQRLQKEGEEGRKKITQITRYGTVLISTLQAYGISVFLESLDSVTVGNQLMQVVPDDFAGFRFIAVVSLVTGTIFIMWLGEQITERGIGNGISLIIMIGIVARIPMMILTEIDLIQNDLRGPLTEVVLMGIMVVIVGFVVLITQGTRKIPVQYAKRVVGRKVYGGQSTHIPMRVNTAGVMPIIFAQAIMFIPVTILQYTAGGGEEASASASWLITVFSDIQGFWYNFFFAVMIILFTYFYTAIAFDPVQVSTTMKQQGGFIPGVRPGKKTAEFIDNILTRVTLPGSFSLAFIAIFPYILMQIMDIDFNLASFFGGTSLLIVVGVGLDTIQQIESHLMMRHYDGFLSKGRIRGRRRM